MNSGIDAYTNDIHQGDAADRLAEMPASSIHCAVTSPPYFGLRDYDAEGQIGLEENIDEYIDALLEVADEIRRVLRDDGSWWLNLGDTFASKPGWGEQSDAVGTHDAAAGDREQSFQRKQKMLVPHRVAIALQDAGWIVRSDAVWSKPNPTPHPVKDRLHEHKEFVFHLTPAPDYWFDLDSIREPHKTESLERTDYEFNSAGLSSMACPRDDAEDDVRIDGDDALHPNGKNPGDILEVPVRPFPEAHFAVYPPELVETPIKSSCPPTVCAECGTPYERATETVPAWERDPAQVERPQLSRALEKADAADLSEEHFEAIRAVGLSDADYGKETLDGHGNNTDRVEQLAAEAKDALGGYFREFLSTTTESDGFEQACDCETDATESGIVLDPFAGAGTTCLVAKRLGRRFVGTELNPDYVALAQKRIGITVDEPDRLLEDDETSLTAFTNEGHADD